MNKAKLKTYAPQARKDFIQMIRQRADLLGLTKREVETPEVSGEVAVIEGRPYPKRYAELHKKLAEKIKAEGLEQFSERIAYSWFNRFAALRFMEVNDFLSHGFRVLSNREAGKNEPEILTHAAEIELPGLDKNKVIELKLAGNKDAELYRQLLIAQCNELHRAMPFLFEKINDETEILLPDNLLATDSVIRKMVAAIDEADWAEVEIIGWLYQFYISEKKDEVIGKTVKSEDIPAATQLFTPNWIVKYMTQNSLGRLWLEANPHSQLARNMEFYIKPADENQTVSSNSNINPEEIRVLDPACGSGHILVEAYELLKAIYTERGYSSRDIPLLILEKNLFGLDIDERAAQMANFALLMKARRDDRRIFERLNQKSEKQIPNILTVPDSSQLPYEARGIAEMFFSRDASSANAAVPIRDGNFLFDEMQVQQSLVMSDSAAAAVGTDSGASEQNVIDLLELFEQGKTLGSLIRIPHGFGAVVDKLEKAVETKLLSGNFYEQVAARELEPFMRAGRMLANKYDCVIANPPYMGGKGMNGELKAFAAKNFPDSKSDLFAMFIERGFELLKRDGLNAMVTMQSWMFLSSFEKLRGRILDEKTIVDLTQIGYNSFPTLNSKIAQAVVFTSLNKYIPGYKGVYVNLNNVSQSANKETVFKNSPNTFVLNQNDFKRIPGSPIAYWVSNKMREVFASNVTVQDLSEVIQGMITGNNELFLRFWHELKACNTSMFGQSNDVYWFPYNKGGETRKWYGNQDLLVNWQNEGRDFVRNRSQSKHLYFKEYVAWSYVAITTTARFYQSGFLWDVHGSGSFPLKKSNLFLIMSILCSNVGQALLSIINPTLSFQVENINLIPIIQSLDNKSIQTNAEEAVAIARADWDSFETSWDFTRLPMLDNDELPAELTGNAENTRQPSEYTRATAPLTQPPAENNLATARSTMPPAQSTQPLAESAISTAESTMPTAENTKATAPFTQAPSKHSVEAAWNKWKLLCDERIARMQELETENNRLFIEAYGLEDELAPEVPLAQITLMRADAEKDTRRLLSYFVGCLMGRYSLDAEGLIYADSSGKGFEASNYQTFPADDDGIVPITDMEWFPQESARQFERFVRVAWGEAKLNQNLRWIAEQLGGKPSETPIETVRRYFSTAFFKDHLQTYKKRPIYWLFSSGKQKAFECLVYLHRYNESTLPRMRHEYVLPLMSKLEAQIETLAGKSDAFGSRTGGLIDSADSTSEKTKLGKQRDILQKKQAELAAFDEKLRHYSDMRISLDLDDGVKVNYGKFGDLLAEVKQVATTKK